VETAMGLYIGQGMNPAALCGFIKLPLLRKTPSIARVLEKME
jgi:hypothetical protein